MKVFISSLITGMEAERTAVAAAIAGLGHDVVRAEDFSADPEAPRLACLAGVRQSDVFILIAGPRYGRKQQSGKSATHEEYDTATASKPVFVFVDGRIEPEPEQAVFLAQVQDWQSGRFTARYETAEQLRQEVSKALHRWLMAQAAGSFDAAEAEERALRLLPRGRGGFTTGKTALVLSVAPGPAQSVLRPSELDTETLGRHLIKEALFGAHALFEAKRGTAAELDGHSLVVRNDREFISIDEQGSIVVARTLSEGDDGIPAVIEEEVRDKAAQSLRFAMALLDHVDPTHKLTHAVPALNLYEASYRSWRTRAEHERSRSSGTMNMHASSEEPVLLRPAHRPRGALEREAGVLGEDLTVLLKRSRTK